MCEITEIEMYFLNHFSFINSDYDIDFNLDLVA